MERREELIGQIQEMQNKTDRRLMDEERLRSGIGPKVAEAKAEPEGVDYQREILAHDEKMLSLLAAMTDTPENQKLREEIEKDKRYREGEIKRLSGEKNE